MHLSLFDAVFQRKVYFFSRKQKNHTGLFHLLLKKSSTIKNAYSYTLRQIILLIMFYMYI